MLISRSLISLDAIFEITLVVVLSFTTRTDAKSMCAVSNVLKFVRAACLKKREWFAMKLRE